MCWGVSQRTQKPRITHLHHSGFSQSIGKVGGCQLGDRGTQQVLSLKSKQAGGLPIAAGEGSTTAVPSWSRHRHAPWWGQVWVRPLPFPISFPLSGKSWGDGGTGGLEPARPRAAAQRAWAPLQLFQRCKTASSTVSHGAQPFQMLSPSRACNEPPRDGARAALAEHTSLAKGDATPSLGMDLPAPRHKPGHGTSPPSLVKQPQISPTTTPATRPGSPWGDGDRVCSWELHGA